MNLFNLTFFSIENNFNNSYYYENNSNNSNFKNSPEKPLPKKVFNCLNDTSVVKSYRSFLKNKSGIYSLVNETNGKQYIGSAKDLYMRLVEHIVGKKSNKSLQIAIKK